MRGLVSKRNCKLQDPEFIKLFKNFDIFLLAEAWTNSESKVDVRGLEHIAIHRPRRGKAKRDSGGIIVYYRAEFSHHIRLERSTEDSILGFELVRKLSQVTLTYCFALAMSYRLDLDAKIYLVTFLNKCLMI